MNVSRLQKMIIGLIVIFIGVKLLLGSLGFLSFGVWDLWPLLFLYLGWRHWEKKRRFVGGVLLGLGLMFALEEWFSISIDDVFGILVAAGLVYVGFRLIRSRQSEPYEHMAEPDVSPRAGDKSGWKDRVRRWPGVRWNGDWRRYGDAGRKWKAYGPKGNPCHDCGKQEQKQRYGKWQYFESPFEPGQVFSARDKRSSLIGDFHLTSGRFELRDLHIWHGVGDVKIDLSRALIPEEETFLIVNGWIGDVTIYVPIDLSVAVAAEVTLGDLEVFGHRQGGLNRQVVMKAQDYDKATRKVKIIVSLIVGDVDVRYI